MSHQSTKLMMASPWIADVKFAPLVIIPPHPSVREEVRFLASVVVEGGVDDDPEGNPELGYSHSMVVGGFL